jgi:glutamate---cysteine ligase / carboxylate-amine ligase
MMKVDYPATAKLPLFSAYGVEIEYMIVDRTALNVLPIADQLFYLIAGSYESEVNRGAISWSNEISLHLVELKTSAPERSLEGLYERFQQQVRDANSLLASFNAMLMPTAMHPWMHPDNEMRIWPHGNITI